MELTTKCEVIGIFAVQGKQQIINKSNKLFYKERKALTKVKIVLLNVLQSYIKYMISNYSTIFSFNVIKLNLDCKFKNKLINALTWGFTFI